VGQDNNIAVPWGSRTSFPTRFLIRSSTVDLGKILMGAGPGIKNLLLGRKKSMSEFFRKYTVLLYQIPPEKSQRKTFQIPQINKKVQDLTHLQLRSSQNLLTLTCPSMSMQETPPRPNVTSSLLCEKEVDLGTFWYVRRVVLTKDMCPCLSVKNNQMCIVCAYL
jgi:hypothetical protein